MIKDLTLKWWQAGIYEISLFSLGLMVGVRWFDFWESYQPLFFILFFFSGAYIFWIWLKPARS